MFVFARQYTALQRQKAVFAYLLGKQISYFAFAGKYNRNGCKYGVLLYISGMVVAHMQSSTLFKGAWHATQSDVVPSAFIHIYTPKPCPIL